MAKNQVVLLEEIKCPFCRFLTYFIYWQNEPVFCVIFEGFF